jgi:hypothetical protein
MEVVMAHTTDEWLEGIPPVRQTITANNSRLLLLRLLNSCTIAFKSCAITQLVIDDKNMGFSSKYLSEAARNNITEPIT